MRTILSKELISNVGKVSMGHTLNREIFANIEFRELGSKMVGRNVCD